MTHQSPDVPSSLPAPSPPVPVRKPVKLRVAPVRVGGFLAQMRIRKKLMVLHTSFSLGLAVVLLVLLKPAITEVVEQSEVDEAKLVLRALAVRQSDSLSSTGSERLEATSPSRTVVNSGSPDQIGIVAELASRTAGSPGVAFPAPALEGVGRAAMFLPDSGPRGTYYTAQVRITEARDAVRRLYLWTAAALLGVYGLVALALEFFVLPQYVYAPIRRMLDAERAVQDGRSEEELIPEPAIPADELGEIMRSRNASIVALRKNEGALAAALSQLEVVATDLKRKNHLLENAKRNLADADRLASLGMMSAGIAHELNTPLAVLKGLVEKLDAAPTAGLPPTESRLMLRVVGRLERLGEGLLDFARVRPPSLSSSDVSAIIDEAITLVRLDRKGSEITIRNAVAQETFVQCDADRMVQVFLNLIRNAADAIRRRPEPSEAGRERGRITIDCERVEKDGRGWVGVSVIDNGPGIDPEVLPRLFEPFVSTRLDAHGTGLGLAVSDGIVREHGGVILARNCAGSTGSVFEVMLPATVGVAGAQDATGPTLKESLDV